MRTQHRLSVESVAASVPFIDPAFLNSPQFVSESLGALLDTRLVVKVETVNPIRCFKGRGAELIIRRAAQTAAARRVICASAGNFGQAIAYSCRKQNMPCTIYAATNANPYKLQRMRALGAEVVLHGNDFDGAKLQARQFAQQTQALFVEDGQEVEGLAGAGTIALELLQFVERIEAVLVPLGNGALFNGMARVLKHHRPGIEMIAVQAQGAPAMVESWRAATPVTHPSVHTIADGIAVRIPIAQALADMDGLIDDAMLVDENQIVEAMRLVHRHLGLVSEPSGSVGVAALLAAGGRFKGKTVATVICGGNLTEEQVKTWLHA
jgi:threonine dehydratase